MIHKIHEKSDLLEGNSLKLKCAIYLLLIFSFWNVMYQTFQILSCFINEPPIPFHYYFSIFSMLSVLFCSIFAYIFYYKRKRLRKWLKIKMSAETIIATFYFITICVHSFSTPYFYYIDYSNRYQEYLLNLISVMILSNIFFLLLESYRLKIILAIIITGIWISMLIPDLNYENALDIAKLSVHIFKNISLVIFIFYYEKTKIIISNAKTDQLEMKIFECKPKLAKLPTTTKATSLQQDILYKFLNSFNSGILIFDSEVKLIFLNRKMKKFIQKSPSERIKKSIDSNRENDNEKKDDISQKIYELNDIKSYFPEEKSSFPLSSEASSLIKFQNIINDRDKNNSDFELQSSLSFKNLLKMIKTIFSDPNHSLNPLLTEHHLLFHYTVKKNRKSPISIEDSTKSFFDVKYIEIRISLIEYDKIKHFLFEFTNETERKRSVELSNINEYQSKILSHVAHEFRTPLNSIIGNLELVQELSEIDNNLKENHINPALFSSTLLLNYVNDILDFSQMRSRKLKLNYVQFNLSSHIFTVSKIMEVLAKKKSVIFEKEIDEALPNLITSDPNRLTQIILNLLSNAFKFTRPNGKVILKVSFEEIDNLVRFEIVDDGIGISAENIRKLFKEFGKIDAPENTIMNPSGVGLGLLISQKFAEEMGPAEKSGFEVKSEMGKGTSFSFYLEDKIDFSEDYRTKTRKSKMVPPISTNRVLESKDELELVLKDQNIQKFKEEIIMGSKLIQSNISLDKSENNIISIFQTYDSKKLPSLKTPSLRDLKCFPVNYCFCPRILVVDDDMFNVSYLKSVLKLLGHDSDHAFNGAEAVNKVKEKLKEKCCEKCKPFKLIFMDAEMPILKGYEATIVIKALCNEVSIVGCTGNMGYEDIKKFENAGVEKVLLKPIAKKNMIDILELYEKVLK